MKADAEGDERDVRLVQRDRQTIVTRPFSTEYRGPLAIHASQQNPESQVVGDYWVMRGGFAASGVWCAPALMRPSSDEPMLALPLGAVVATCTLVDVVPIVAVVHGIQAWTDGRLVWVRGWLEDDRDLTDQRPYGDFSPGRYAWLLADIKPLDEPIPAKGRQGLWEWDEMPAKRGKA